MLLSALQLRALPIKSTKKLTLKNFEIHSVNIGYVKCDRRREITAPLSIATSCFADKFIELYLMNFSNS